jgi:CTP synthase (UTP-ammonia lyase)
MTTLALLGDRDLSYLTHRELEAAVAQLPAGIEARWAPTDSAAARELAWADGIWVLPGTPYRDTDAVLRAIGRALEDGTPLLGTCGGFQHVVLVLAERLAGVAAPAHAELAPDAADPVVAPLACSLLGEESEVDVVPATRAADILGAGPRIERFFCTYGLEERYRTALAEAGMVFSATDNTGAVRMLELPTHPFYIGTLYQPELSSDATWVHPLIRAFAAAALRRANRPTAAATASPNAGATSPKSHQRGHDFGDGRPRRVCAVSSAR